jgi:dTDP-4-dehydrorhamnose reductase
MALRHRRQKLMLITGGAGFLGQHLTHGSASDGWELIAPSSAAMDIRRREFTIDTITDWKPSAVVHLAYRKGERSTIVDGSRNVAEAAAACGARLVHMSTDVVFPGRSAPYTETDHPFPMIDYGHHKLDAEAAVAEACPSALVVRTSLLYGTAELGHLQVDVERALDGRPTTFFTDEYRCPAHVDDVAAAVAQLAAMPDVSGVLHVAGPEPISRADFALQTARWMGRNAATLRTGTIADSGLVRPANVVLDSTKAAAIGIRCRSVSDAYRR